jgi:spermidine/putrescine-binding protein
MKVTKVGANTYAFDFGGGAETIVVDGTDHPGSAGTTLSVAADGPNWKVIRKKDGRMLLTATWTLSKDGNSLNDDFTSFGQDGSPSNVKYVYERRAAGSGFAGTWVSSTAAVNSVIILQVRPYGSNGLSFIIPSQGQTLNVNFDGKDYPNADADSASSARRLNAHAVEIIRKSKSKITQTREIKLSPDLKTLTMTVYLAGKDEPYIYIFERQ